MVFSMMAALALEATVSISDYQAITDADADRRARSCGLNHIAISHDELEQNDYLIVSDEEISPDQLMCLATAFDATNLNVIVPEAHIEAFYRFANELAAPRNRRIAREQLAEMGYSEPPTYDPATMTDAEYAKQLEQFCGPEAEGALGSTWGPRTLSPGFVTLEDLSDEAKLKAQYCLFVAGAVSGFNIGFIGNERVAEDPAATSQD
jgi:hypothetical protein